MGDTALVIMAEPSVAEVTRHVQMIHDLMSTHMKEGTHYGASFPGDTKKNLLKAGADKLGLLFHFVAEYDVDTTDLSNGHREHRVVCHLYTMNGHNLVGEGLGSASTMESKYRWRNSSRKCPHCGQEAIIKGKEEYGGGWICFKKKNGCGATFQDNDPAIVNQSAGKVENPDIADTYNTVLKIAKKRAYVDATISATAASDIFTQDAEDFAPDRSAPATEPEPTIEPLAETIKTARADFVAILTSKVGDADAFTVDEKAKAKDKLNRGQETSQAYLDYVHTVVREYQGKLDERRAPKPEARPTVKPETKEEPKQPSEPTITTGAELAKKFGVEIPEEPPKELF